MMTALRKDRETTIQYLSGMGQKEEFRKANPRYFIHKAPINTGRDHVKFLYEYVYAFYTTLIDADGSYCKAMIYLRARRH